MIIKVLLDVGGCEFTWQSSSVCVYALSSSDNVFYSLCFHQLRSSDRLAGLHYSSRTSLRVVGMTLRTTVSSVRRAFPLPNEPDAEGKETQRGSVVSNSL